MSAQKLKRYGFVLVKTGPQPEPYSPAPHEWEWHENADGEYVLFSEAQALNAELLEALEAFVDACDKAPPIELMVRISNACDNARTILLRVKA